LRWQLECSQLAPRSSTFHGSSTFLAASMSLNTEMAVSDPQLLERRVGAAFTGENEKAQRIVMLS